MAFGYRIFAVQAFRNRVQGNEPADASAGGDLHKHVLACLDDMEGRTFFQRVREPADPDPLMPKKKRKSISFRQCQEWEDGWVHLQVSIGREGDHDRATAEGLSPLIINQRSAESRRFVTMVFPPSGDRFLLVSEAIGSSDAKALVLSQLTQASMRLREDAKKASQQARKVAASAKVTPLPRVVRQDRYLFQSQQMVDGEYLDDLLTRADRVDAVFTLNLPSPRGGSATYQRKRLVVRVEEEAERLGTSRVGKRWYQRSKDRKGVGQREAIAELDQVLSLDDRETSDYDEVEVKVRTKDAETVTVGPLTAREVFTYPLSWSQCSPVHYYSKVADRLRTVAALNDIEIAMIDHKEAAACLPEITDDPTDASTQLASSEPREPASGSGVG